MKKLWDKGANSNALMQALCTAEDPKIDSQLAWYDCVGSIAHAEMLKKQGILTAKEFSDLSRELKKIAKSAAKISKKSDHKSLAEPVGLDIPEDLEDCHTTIENELCKKLGKTGKKIHTGRSRNDQSALMMRLYLRAQTYKIAMRTFDLLTSIEKLNKKYGKILIPGYTHMQPAMPSSVCMWLHSSYEGLLRFVNQAKDFYKLINVCPLGSGAGFGTSLKLDREFVARKLGFAGVQKSFVDVNNSRGFFDESFLHMLGSLAFVADKSSCDLMLYLSKEFSLVKLSDALRTGSSIIPQKSNPDLVELLRARCARMRALQVEELMLISKLPSSYNRDLQFTKRPVMEGVKLANEIILSLELLLNNIEFNKDAAEKLMYPELFATYLANNLVNDGMPFRDAYAEVAKQLKQGVKLKADDFKENTKVPLGEAEKYFGKSVLEKKHLLQEVFRGGKVERLILKGLV